MQGVTGEKRPPNLPSYIVAVHRKELSEKDKALTGLEKSYEKRATFQMYLKVDSRLDPLRDDPRFDELLKKVGFPQ